MTNPTVYIETTIPSSYHDVRQTPEMIARAAIDEDVDVIGLSILSGAHRALFPSIFEALREAGLSVTQATRILAYRERFGGYGSVDDLEKVPGFPSELIDSLRGRITI